MTLRTTVSRFLKSHYIGIAFGIALLIRLGYVFALEDRWYYFDTVHYDTAAKSLLQGDGFGKSLHFHHTYKQYCLEPVYPLFLAAIYSVTGQSFLAVRIVQIFISLLYVWILFLLCKKVHPPSAPIVLIYAAIYPFFIYLTGLLYPTLLFSLFILLAIYFFVKYNQSYKLIWVVFGAVFLGMATVTRLVVLPSIFFIGLWIIVFTHQSWLRRILHIACLFAISGLMLIPWSLRNGQVYGKFTPGRVCLSETRHFDHFVAVLRYKDYYKVESFPGRRVRFDLEPVGQSMLFHYFLDETYLGTLQPVEDISIPPRGYFGLIIKGGNPLYLPMATFEGADSGTIALGGVTSIREFVRSPKIEYGLEGISIPVAEEKWEHKIISTWTDSITNMEIFLPDPVSPHDVHRIAFLVGLDSLSLKANGYMIWMHPWLEADLWRFQGGVPEKDIKFRDIGRLENPMTLSRLIVKEPVRFFTHHVFVEFINFWSPVISKIKTDSNVSPYMNVVSIIFYTPILLLFLLCFVMMRKQWSVYLLLLIPIGNLSLFYSIFFTQMRYRLPIDGFLMILGAMGLTGLVIPFLRGLCVGKK